MKKERNEVIIPESTQEVNKLIQEIGEFQARKQKIKQEEAEEMKKIRNRTKRRLTQGQRAIKRRFKGLYIFYQTHRNILFKEAKTKIIKFTAGEIGMYKPSPKVRIRSKKKVIKALEMANLKKFLRIIPEINKEAILADPRGISGISGIKVVQKEKFKVRPKETGETFSENTEKLKKFLS